MTVLVVCMTVWVCVMAMQYKMNVEYVMVMVFHVLIVLAFPMELIG